MFWIDTSGEEPILKYRTEGNAFVSVSSSEKYEDYISEGSTQPSGTDVKFWLDTSAYNTSTGEGIVLKYKSSGGTFVPISSVPHEKTIVYEGAVSPSSSNEALFWLDTSGYNSTTNTGAILKYKKSNGTFTPVSYIDKIVYEGSAQPSSSDKYPLWIDIGDADSETGEGAILKYRTQDGTYVPISSSVESFYESDIEPLADSNVQMWIDTSAADPTTGEGAILKYRKEIGGVVQYIPLAGGGTSSSGLKVVRVTPSPLVNKIGEDFIFEIEYTSKDSGGDTVGGIAVWNVDGTDILTQTISYAGQQPWTHSADLTRYMTIGTHSINLTVTDNLGNVSQKDWTARAVDFRLTSDFRDSTPYEENTPIIFTYTPYGASIQKTVTMKINGETYSTNVVTDSGIPKQFIIPSLTHGSYLIECYETATINGVFVRSESVFKDLICFDSSNDDPVIGCAIRSIAVNQYDTVRIPYYAYYYGSEVDVFWSIDGREATKKTLTTNADEYTFKTGEVGTHTLTLSCGDYSIDISVVVSAINLDISVDTTSLAFDFNPIGYSNSSANRLWSDSEHPDIHLTVSDNFDWHNGGYQIDDNGDPYFCVKSGTTATINYEMFKGNLSSRGLNFKVIFKATNVKDADAVFLNCMSSGITPIGLKMQAHMATHRTNSSNIIESRYSEDDIIEYEINIESIDTTDSSATAMIIPYEDGVSLKPVFYGNTNILTQETPLPILIGSTDCDIHIYRMKVYERSLGAEEILHNFILDARSSEEIMNRYTRNQIYDENHNLTPESVANACPDLKVIKIEAPHFTANKKDYVINTKVECIHRNGDPVLDNWVAVNCAHAGQGTTSDNYGTSGRNIDIIMGFDGSDPTGKVKNYDPSYKTILTMGDGTTVYPDGTGKVTLTRTSVPNNWYNIKINIASSENANNALLQKRYNDYLPYTSLAKLRDPYTKNSMEFVNCVVFIRETGAASDRLEFNDSDWHFYAIGNIGDSKKTDVTRASDPTDMNEFTVEISDNPFPCAQFQTGVEYESDIEDDDGNVVHSAGEMKYPILESEWAPGNPKYDSIMSDEFDGKTTFEFRYECCGATKDGVSVETGELIKAQNRRNRKMWREFYKWVITSTDSEFVETMDSWCIRDSMLYWYLFTERYTMVDSRAKNTFWHFGKTGEYHKVLSPDDDFMDMYCEKVNDEYIETSDTTIDPSKTYYWQYAFDMWDYDNDRNCLSL